MNQIRKDLTRMVMQIGYPQVISEVRSIIAECELEISPKASIESISGPRKGGRKKGKSTLSPESRDRIRAAQHLRWDRYRKAKAGSAQVKKGSGK